MRPFLLCVLSLPLLACAEPAAVAASSKAERAGATAVRGAAPAALPLRARLDKDTIRAAVAATPGERDPYPRRHEADTLSSTPRENFAGDFANARLPDCLHAEGLRNQPTFFLNGVLALPFIAVARLRGVCR